MSRGKADPNRTHCKHGHELTEENKYHRPAGGFDCRTCQANSMKSYLERTRSEPVAAETHFKARMQEPDRTHCCRGHELCGDNLRIDIGGRKWCRQCGRDNQNKAREVNRTRSHPLLKHFWRHVSLSAGPQECWPWKGRVDDQGYGIYSSAGCTSLAHRQAWILSHGSIAAAESVRHECETLACCNPSHLFVGARRTRNSFTPEQEKEVLALYQSEDRPNAAIIGAQYGVSSYPVYCVLRKHGVIHKSGYKAIWPIIDGKKQCRACGEWKDVETGFSTDNHSYRSDCKLCRVVHLREQQLRKNFGITGAEYRALEEAQDHVCAICEKPDVSFLANGKSGRRLAVDHDHATGKVRALLCGWCNRAIGFLGDDPERAMAVARYLEKWKAT